LSTAEFKSRTNWKALMTSGELRNTSMMISLLTVMLTAIPLHTKFGPALRVARPSVFASRLIPDEVSTELHNENYRPQFHFTPAKNWMNDPNGPIYYEGEYHLFYQYNPFDIAWGHMSWGHAVSRDLVHWKHLPIALSEENGVMIFSGSTVVDWHNSSGFCHGTGTEFAPCLVAIYTGHSNKLETQNLAYSNDRGRTWTKYADNPVIDLHLASFRDPKVFWHEGTHRWVMVTVLASQHKVRFFGSTDLKHWTALSDFGPAGATGGVWECPDLFSLPVDGDASKTKWVLSVNLPRGAERGWSNQYFIGWFDGTSFSSESSPAKVLWVDYGADFYASTSFSELPKSDRRRIWMGWLTNWEYAARVPPDRWRGAQSIPREVRLKRFADDIRLVQEPIVELRVLRARHAKLENRSIEAANNLLKSKKVHGDTLEIAAEISAEDAAEFGLKVRKGDGEETVIGVDTKKPSLFMDRTRSSDVSFDGHFASRDAGPIRLTAGKSVKLHIFVDRSSVEVFGNDGETVLSETIFPKPGSDGIELYSRDGRARVLKLDVWNLKSIYQ
jgi:fructan beta-fructosidase